MAVEAKRQNTIATNISSWQDDDDSKSLDIYKVHNERFPSDYYREKIRQIKQQKIWVIVHTIFLLTISIISFPLLHKKGTLLHEFYSKPECCYCLWVGHNIHISKHYEIEWSACTHQKSVSFNKDQSVCYYDNNTHCNLPKNKKENGNTDSYFIDLDRYSASSSIFIWRFQKYYPYYAIMNIVLVFAYVSFLIIVTFCYKILLSVQLFIGNIVISINTLYTYIKLYQYGLYDYNKQCPPIQAPIHHTQCYRNALPPVMEEIMHLIVYFVSIYTVYPLIFCIFFRCCRRIRVCHIIRNKLESCLLYLGIIGGIIFLIMGFTMLIYIMAQSSTYFELIKGLSNETERAFIILLTIFLLLFSVDIFLLEHCRIRSSFMLTRWRLEKKGATPYLSLNEPATSEQGNN